MESDCRVGQAYSATIKPYLRVPFLKKRPGFASRFTVHCSFLKYCEIGTRSEEYFTLRSSTKTIFQAVIVENIKKVWGKGRRMGAF